MPSDYKLNVGDKVMATYYAGKKAPYGASSFKNHFYPGKVEAIRDGVCDIFYDDESTEDDVLFASLKVRI